MITKRQSDILNNLIEEYINSAKPVSSQLLERKYNFGICPATIRIELQELTDDGFLSKPHTSSGRVPTDKGYRFFVDSLLKEGISEFDERFRIEEILKSQEDEAVLIWASRLTKFLAEAASSFAILNFPEKEFVFREGWEEILKEPEFGEKNFISDFIKFLANFEKNIDNLKTDGINHETEIKIFIGKESRFLNGDNFSIISSICSFPDWQGNISILGPKRMQYDRNIGLINSLTKLLESY